MRIAHHLVPLDVDLFEALGVVRELRAERDVKPALHELFDLQGQIESRMKQVK